MRLPLLVVVLTIFSVWGSDASVIASEPDFSYGLVQNSCAPWDGPAIDVTLTTVPSAVPTCDRLLPQRGGVARATHPVTPDYQVWRDLGCGLCIALPKTRRLRTCRIGHHCVRKISGGFRRFRPLRIALQGRKRHERHFRRKVV
jgi:hypothetical protein